MDELYINMGIRVKRLRVIKDLSREKLSEMAGISAKFLYSLETGKKGVSARTLYNISQALGVSTDYLLKGKLGDLSKFGFSPK